MIRLLFISLFFFSCTTTKTVINATGSYDPDGWLIGQKVEQISGPKAQIKETKKLLYEINLKKKGVCEFRITIMDNDSATASKVIQKVK